MYRPRQSAALVALLLVGVPAARRAQAQAPSDQDQEKQTTQKKSEEKTEPAYKNEEHGYIDFGVRFATGDVYGRPDLPFDPVLKTSKFNEYRDVRNGFFVRRADVHFDNLLNTKKYVSLQTSKAVYRD